MSWFRRVALITFVLVSCQSIADETRIGIGAVLGSTNGLFLPIQLENLLIEPAITFKKSNEDSFNILDLSRSGRTSKTLTIGVGIFIKRKLTEKSEIYYGARFGFIKRRVEEFFESNTALPSTSSEVEENGFFVSPTIGVQAFIIPQFSIGIDLALQVSTTDGDEKVTSNGVTIIADSEDTSYSSTATVIARYIFD